MYTETTAPDLWEKTGSLMLPENAGSILLPLARAAIAAQMGTTLAASDDAGWLRANGAAFVTLMHAGRLRGCIGTLEAHRALGEDVKANAVAAAFRDPRFKPLDKREFDHLNVEVSVLSAIETIVFRDEDDALAQLHPEIDGVIFEYGHHRSTFLPQVWEDLRDPEQFVSQLKLKAGLSADVRTTRCAVKRYRVLKWRESQFARES